MTFEDANKIFQDWQRYMEINNKLSKIFMGFSLPKSFLPYPMEVLEEAINIVAKAYSDNKDDDFDQYSFSSF